jgi:hypothetical protein
MSSHRRWGADGRIEQGQSADWHDGLEGVFEVMDANLAVRRGHLDHARVRGVASPLDAFDPEQPARGESQPPARPDPPASRTPPPPFVERRKSPPPIPAVSGDDVAPLTRVSDQLSPEALEAIAARVAEKLKASMPVPQPPAGVPERRTANRSVPASQRAGRQPMVTIRIRRPFF